ncbi:type II toxin-antitoxin system VapC family toxin [Gordonia sp. (in: high G+C Gram-positive bacteria)]|uniref:type II toxin-antitoxin system VapC family toxin n=1 Tax=Gordonia sp. (in: high G+C Gram-positive bacteria) TaxID=84139 RepID=UPI001DB7676C|nr:PIN domain-containing protein [Gordonia sp. (in: high G+C Gram-positive bacteria)]MCB1294325.1 PIN domain-containing protein [Gordonia sp. (in: high G+C Gram-positive bacteria)]HMS76593.1 PIN domain-containing protein [Gordonia sp. (in: high G+C Gram-positive bacteria)]HQV18153.1 PIN domain-containing protein [Gordonia sp. (in: high G+C Gram-positive bacteria)]
MRVVADTGGIVAAINTAEPGHVEFLGVLESASAVFVTPLVVAEVHHVLTSAGLAEAADDFLDDVVGGFYDLVNPGVADFDRAGGLVQRYRGSMQRKRRKPGSLDLADAMNVVVAAAKSTNRADLPDEREMLGIPIRRHGKLQSESDQVGLEVSNLRLMQGLYLLWAISSAHG